jgi:hypothetical protein
MKLVSIDTPNRQSAKPLWWIKNEKTPVLQVVPPYEQLDFPVRETRNKARKISWKAFFFS